MRDLVGGSSKGHFRSRQKFTASRGDSWHSKLKRGVFGKIPMSVLQLLSCRLAPSACLSMRYSVQKSMVVGTNWNKFENRRTATFGCVFNMHAAAACVFFEYLNHTLCPPRGAQWAFFVFFSFYLDVLVVCIWFFVGGVYFLHGYIFLK